MATQMNVHTVSLCLFSFILMKFIKPLPMVTFRPAFGCISQIKH